MKQSETFLQGEAMRWYERNRQELFDYNDPILAAIERIPFGRQTDSVLEVGCSNGWRLREIDAKRKEGIDPLGIMRPDDPPRIQGHWPRVWKGTADNLKIFDDASFDLVIYGWCLYLCDREDLFKIAAEGDRVLRDGGFLVIYDFDPGPRHTYKRKYKHLSGLFSYKMNYARLWLWNPAYSKVFVTHRGKGEDRTSVCVLRKRINKGWPLHG